jgi:hypothetical protein
MIRMSDVLKWHFTEDMTDEEWQEVIPECQAIMQGWEAVERILDGKEGWTFTTNEDGLPIAQKGRCSISVDCNTHGIVEFSFFYDYLNDETDRFDAWFMMRPSCLETLVNIFGADDNAV